jgi:hypothetical protein
VDADRGVEGRGQLRRRRRQGTAVAAEEEAGDGRAEEAGDVRQRRRK